VVELVDTYAGWLTLARDLLGEAAASAVFGEVARRVYKL
jgi:hypothetical protein